MLPKEHSKTHVLMNANQQQLKVEERIFFRAFPVEAVMMTNHSGSPHACISTYTKAPRRDDIATLIENTTALRTIFFVLMVRGVVPSSSVVASELRFQNMRNEVEALRSEVSSGTSGND
jgi:hypothetical protein